MSALLPRSLTRTVRSLRDRWRAGRGLASASAEHYRLLADNARDIIWRLEFPDRLTYVSPACERILGWTPAELTRRPGRFSMLAPESAAHVERLLETALAEGLEEFRYAAEHPRRDGGSVWCEARIAILRDASGEPFGILGVTRDASEKRDLREQLLQAQKMESLGLLAGGVAHDFNNYLTVILSYLDALGDEVPKNDPNAELIREARLAAESSATLTRKLLAFSRRQPMQVRVFDLNALVSRSLPMLRRLAGERIALQAALLRGRAVVRADPSQIDQALLNLVANAADAIASQGTIAVETADVVLDAESAAQRGIVPGRFVKLAVTDTGAGMDADTAARAFEPFFSTKEERSTGLGLSTVYGVAKQCGGDVSIASELGRGTIVTLLLPRAAGDADPEPLDDEPVDPDAAGDETILVVEDQELVRRTATHLLERAGYAVLAAEGPEEALRLLDGEGAPPALVLTDVVLPVMRGPELVERVRVRYPAVPAVFMSGYSEQAIAGGPGEPLPGPLVRKPFHQRELLGAVRRALDAVR